MNRRIASLLLAVIAITLLSWGVTGHHVIGKIAENHLSPKAHQAVQELLGNESLADIASWADEVRGEPEYKQTASWHFLNLPLGLSYKAFQDRVENMGADNVYGALQKCEHDLTAPSTTKEQKKVALKFIVHFVGDLHQPMHISRAEDKGGNTIQLNYDGKGTNLHSLWDSKLLEHEGLSYEQLATKYDHIPQRQIKSWQSDPLIKWIWESYEISSTLYKEVDAMNGRTIGDKYYQAHIGIIEERIEKAGIRLAGLLNELFKDGLANSSAMTGAVQPFTKKTGQSTTICEKVYDGKVMEGSGMTLLNLGRPYPNQTMTIMIKGKDRAKFIKAPESLYMDKHICVTGTVTNYKGKPEIIVSDPSQIKVK